MTDDYCKSNTLDINTVFLGMIILTSVGIIAVLIARTINTPIPLSQTNSQNTLYSQLLQSSKITSMTKEGNTLIIKEEYI